MKHPNILQNVGVLIAMIYLVYATKMIKNKSSKQLERHFKGVANHWRIEILNLVATTKGISLEDMSSSLGCNIKTISEHAKKLVQAGLVNKRYQGRTVAHSLSPYGKIFYDFIKTSF